MITKRKAPYSTTTKDPDLTIVEINRMLKKNGITNYQWTTLYDKNMVELKFTIETAAGKNVVISVKPPSFVARRKTWNAKAGKYETKELPNWSQSFRLLYWWLKVKVEAVSFGLTEAETEFLGEMVVKLPNGRETTVAEAILPRLSEGRLDLPSLEENAEDQAVKCGPYVDVPYRRGGD